MQIEFKILLKETLLDLREEFSSLIKKELEENYLKNVKIEVLEIPSSLKIEGDFFTNISFFLASYFNNTLKGEFITPLLLSSLIKDNLSKKNLRLMSYFKVFIGGDGYLNVKVYPSFSYVYVDRLSKFLYFPILEETSLFSKEEEIRELSYKKFKEVKSVLSDFSKELLPKNFFEDDGLETLLSLAKEDSFRRQDAKLQLLGMVKNRELGSLAFLLNTGGKENVPWYLNKFLEDADLFYSKLLDFKKNKKKFEGSKQEHEFSLDFWCKDSLTLLLNARIQLINSIRQKKAYYLLQYMIKVIDSFYRYYNHPQVRALSFEEREIKLLCDITNSLLMFVKVGYNTLF